LRKAPPCVERLALPVTNITEQQVVLSRADHPAGMAQPIRWLKQTPPRFFSQLDPETRENLHLKNRVQPRYSRTPIAPPPPRPRSPVRVPSASPTLPNGYWPTRSAPPAQNRSVSDSPGPRAPLPATIHGTHPALPAARLVGFAMRDPGECRSVVFVFKDRAGFPAGAPLLPTSWFESSALKVRCV